MLKFDVYKMSSTGATHTETVEWNFETDSVATIEARKATVLEYAKDKSVVVSVNGVDAAWFLGQPKRRGRKVIVDPEVVKAVHQLYVTEDVPIQKIVFKIYENLLIPSGLFM